MRIEIMAVILAMAVATFFTRFASQAIWSGGGTPKRLERLLKHVPTAILTSLIAPAIIAPQGAVMINPGNHYLLAGLIAAALAYRRMPPVITMWSAVSAAAPRNI